MDECADCRADPAAALADVVQACDLWSVAESASLREVLDRAGDVDDERFDAMVAALADALWTPEHTRRLALLVDRVRRRLPRPGRPRASEALAAACVRLEGDEAVRMRTAALLLADTLAPLRAIAAGARLAA